MTEILSEDLKQSLNKLCTELQLFVNQTEESLQIAEDRFNQSNYVLKPWNIKNPSKELKCICKSSTSTTSTETKDCSLLSSVSKTLNDAQLARKKSLNQLNKKINTRKSESVIRSKAKDDNIKKSFSNLDVSTKTDHRPCCPLFNLEIKLNFSFNEAIKLHKIPVCLLRTIKSSQKLLINNKNDYEDPYKNQFLQSLENQNEINYLKFQKQEPVVKSFIKYLSTIDLSDCETECSNETEPWLFYDDVKSLEVYQKCRSKSNKKNQWDAILQLIIDELIPVLQVSDLDKKQKVYLFKILKSICNFAHSSSPTVPLFRVVSNTY